MTIRLDSEKLSPARVVQKAKDPQTPHSSAGGRRPMLVVAVGNDLPTGDTGKSADRTKGVQTSTSRAVRAIRAVLSRP